MWRSTRRIVRCLRILGLLLVLAAAGFLFYCSQAGLPGFIKRAILSEFRTHGVELTFARIRFRWDRGIVAEKVSLSHAQQVAGPRLTVAELQMGINAGEALRGRIHLDALRLRGGQLAWHFAGTNQPAMPLELFNLETELLLHDSNWELKDLRARFHATDFQVVGVLSNASALARWWSAPTNLAAGATAPPSGAGPDAALRRLASALEQWQFAGEPTVHLDGSLDAANWAALRLNLRLKAGAAQTPYGAFTNLAIAAHLRPSTNQPGWAQFDLQAVLGRGQTPWGAVDGGQLQVRHQSPWQLSWQTNLTATLACRQLDTRWFQGHDLDLAVTLTPAATNLAFSGRRLEIDGLKTAAAQGTVKTPVTSGAPWQLDFTAAELNAPGLGTAGRGKASLRLTLAGTPLELRALQTELELAEVQAPWGKASALSVAGEAEAATNWLATLRATNQFIWDRLAPLNFRWDARLHQVQADRLVLDAVETAGSWRAPWLKLDRLKVDIKGGQLALAGQLNAATRQLEAGVTNQFDVRQIADFLPQAAREILLKLTWENPPRVAGAIRAHLPPWDQWTTNAWAETWAGASLDARLDSGPVQFEGFTLSELSARAAWTNGWWQVADLHARAGPHRVWADAQVNPDGRFHLQAQSLATQEAIYPLLGTNTQRKLAIIQFASAPWLEVAAEGNWNQPETLRCRGEVRMTNAMFRQVAIDLLHTRFSYATNVLRFDQPRVERPEGSAEGDAVVADFNRQIVRLENARGQLDPQAVTRAIGEQVAQKIAPYHFHNAPQARVEGEIPMRGEQGARVRFEVAGGPFQWWRFQPTNIAATVWWVDKSVIVTNLVADFYGGRLQGDLAARFAGTNGTDMTMHFGASQVHFSTLMGDISDRTNTVEGLLSGYLSVRAIAEDWHSWNGFGNVELKDGLIWNIPVFGLVSPILNTISPDLGNSRAREGKATFVITNSVIHSEDLEIQAVGYNLKYRGTVDFDYQLDARAEAEVLREAWMLGPALSLVFKPFTKLFEYRVTGTLSEPKTSPVYIPKFLLKVFSPVKSIKELFRPETSKEPPPP